MKKIFYFSNFFAFCVFVFPLFIIGELGCTSVAQSPYEAFKGTCCMHYATKAQDTGQKWIDGKQIFAKTLLFDIKNNGMDYTQIVDTGEEMERLVKIEAFIDIDIGYTVLQAPLPMYREKNGANAYIYIRKGGLSELSLTGKNIHLLYDGGGMNGRQCTTTIFYTKP